MRRFVTIPLMAIAALALQLNAEATEAEVVAVVSADNPIDSISRIELTNIFLGKSGSFPGGAPAQPVDLREGAQSRVMFYSEFAGKSPAQLKAYWSKMIFTGRGQPPKAVDDGNAVKQWLAQNPNAIGYLDNSLVDDRVKIVSVE
ncbi:phosphate ABC transporter substrate-binding protein [Onishia niordana]|uniref:phosphate ABC transporter substrate-binding protein n=1 Tax=Onishia niordana TaxID=2508711 RepID=UPI001F117146|nr:phosphate ABC transporter substrate-binding protein [Halomonas niordiana]